MSRNGSGAYSLPSGNPVVPSTVISSTWANNTLSDIATALTQSIANDGQTTPVANLPMATFRHTNVGNAQARTDYAAAGQVQDSSLQWLTSVAGTDTITASLTPSPGAYTAGQTFRFTAAGNSTTAAPTLNINGLGAKTITRLGTQGLVAGDIRSGSVVTVTYDGTQFQILGTVSSGAIIGSARNVAMNVTAASATGTLTADELILESALGGVSYKLTSFSQAINLATTGAGGMDTGTAPVSGYVALYAIYNPTTGASALLGKNATAGVQTQVYSGANMPSGYTASALVAVVPTNASSQFQILYVLDREVFVTVKTVLNTATQQASPTSFSISSAVPPNARTVSGEGSVSSTANAGLDFFLTASSTIGQKHINQSWLTANITNLNTYSNLPIITSQTIFYVATITAGTMNLSVLVTSYTF